MAAVSLPLLQFSLFISFLLSVASQSSPATDTDFSCSPASPPSCETFLTYRAGLSSNLLNLGAISDLFGVSPSSIAKATGLSSEEANLFPNQILLIPIRCNCNGSFFFYNVTYQIKKDDTFYSISTRVFQNLTNYHLVEEMNQELKPLNLTIGEEAIFPLLCKCPSNSNLINGFKYLITYVWQPSDDLLSVSSIFNSTPLAIAAENNYRNFSAAVCLPLLIPVQTPRLLQSFSLALGHKSRHHNWIALAAVLSTILVLAVLILCFLLYYHLSFKKRSQETNVPIQIKRDSKDGNFDHPKICQDKLLPGVSGYLGKIMVYDVKVIIETTLDLNERYRIGESVYLAKINDQFFAVKKKRDATEELRILQKVNHGNLVKLMGMSSDDEKNLYLVFEYAENGSLDKWLFPKSSSSFSGSMGFLTWNQRLYIALDVANGLQYLHEHAQPSIAHRNIRSSNILLDSRFKAKIANFSLAQNATNSAVIKVDVFAFGVVLLELLSGRKSMETMENGEIIMLWKEIREILEDEEKKEERLREWMDPRLESFYPIDNALSLATLARACTSERPSERPKMAEIVFSLCVLTQSSLEIYDRSWISGEAEEASDQTINPITAR